MRIRIKRGLFWILSFFLVVFCSSGTVWAMAENNFSVNNRSGSYYGRDRQALAKNRADDFSIALTYGFRENYRDGGHVPVTVDISNNGYNEFNGYLVLETAVNTDGLFGYSDVGSALSSLFPEVKSSGSQRKSVFTYRLPIRIQENETVTKFIAVGLDISNYNSCRVSIENLSQETVYQENVILSPAENMSSYLYVGVLEKENYCASVLNGQSIGNSGYEFKAFSMLPEEITESMLDANVPDILVLLDYDFGQLSDDQQKLLSEWENHGGVLVSFNGNQVFSENQKNLFEMNPIVYMEYMLDQDTISRFISERDVYFQKYFYMTDLLENMEVRKQPSVFLYGILLGIYMLLVGPGLYLILKRLKKRDYLWLGICICSLCFIVLIGILGSQTRMKAPVITYLEEIRQYDDHAEDNIDFCIQAPYNSSYCLYVDPKYQITPYNWSGISSSNNLGDDQDFSSYEQVSLNQQDERTEITLSNMSAFALNFFHLKEKEEEKEKEGLITDLHFFDGCVNGFVENRTGYELENCILIMPGYCVELGNLADGETRSLNQKEANAVRDAELWDDDQERTETERTYLRNLYYSFVINRRDRCLLVGKIDGKQMDFQMNSGYEICGASFYLSEVEVNMEKDGILYCPYAQQYSLWDEGNLDFQAEADSWDLYSQQTKVTYNLNCVFEKYNAWTEYLDYIRNDLSLENENVMLTAGFLYDTYSTCGEKLSQIASGVSEIPRGEILSLEFKKTEEKEDYRDNFDGTIEIYNYWTGDYEVLENWKLDFTSDTALSMKYLDHNRIRVRFTVPDQKEEQADNCSDYYRVPTLIVKAREYSVEQYLQSVFRDGVEIYAED